MSYSCAAGILLTGLYVLVQLFAGRKLDYEPKNCQIHIHESDYIIVVELSKEDPYGKLLALLYLKFGVLKVQEEWGVISSITLAFILTEILRKEGKSVFIANVEKSKKVGPIEDYCLEKERVTEKSTMVVSVAEAEKTQKGGCEGLLKNDRSGSCGSGCGGGCGNMNSGGCGSGCGSGCGNMVKSSGCSSGFGGGCGNMVKSSGYGSGCGGGCRNMVKSSGCGDGGGCRNMVERSGCGGGGYGGACENMVETANAGCGGGGCRGGCGGMEKSGRCGGGGCGGGCGNMVE